MEEVKNNEFNQYLLLFNIAKKKNIGTLLRSAAAFGVNEVYVLEKSGKKMATFGSQGTAERTDFRFFDSLQDVKAHCKSNAISICGVEIMEGAQPVHTHPFKGSTLFILGNEGSGLNKTQTDICDHFIYISQYSDKTASLNVAIAASIIFHHFAVWAQFKEHKITGQKFVVSEHEGKGKFQLTGKDANKDIEQLKEERKKKKEGSEVVPVENIFGDEDQ